MGKDEASGGWNRYITILDWAQILFGNIIFKKGLLLMSEADIITGQRCATDEEMFEKVKLIIRKFDPERIILFGSYAFGNPNPESDVDLLIIMNSTKPSWEKSVEVSLALKHSFPIDIIVKTPQEIDNRLNAGDFFINDILEKGEVLYERPCK